MVSHRTQPLSRSRLSSTKEDTMTIRVATGDDLPRCASFLAKSMYPSNIPGTSYSLSVPSHHCNILSTLQIPTKEFLDYMHIDFCHVRC